MNDNQLMCLWAGVLACVAMGLFPPWTAGSRFAGYRRLWRQPQEGSPHNDQPLSLDMPRLLIQWAMVAMVTVGLILSCPHKRLTNLSVPDWPASETNSVAPADRPDKLDQLIEKVEKGWRP